MKKLTIKEEAKRYDEALERARECMNDGGISQNTIDYLCNIFPELKEGEAERIRKWCISHFKAAIRATKDNAEYQKYLNNKVIPWLEKQCVKEVDPRRENLEELLAADSIYQMSMNEAMVEEAKSKAINALSELQIGKLLGLEKQGEQPEQDNSDVNDYNSIDPYFGKQIEMRLSWSGEDTSKVQRICMYLNEAKKYFGDVSEVRECIEWLESIKDRIGFGLICTTK